MDDIHDNIESLDQHSFRESIDDIVKQIWT